MKTRPVSLRPRLLRLVGLAGTASALCGSTSAFPEVRKAVDVAVSGNAQSNPYFDTAGGGLTGSLRVSVDPYVVLSNELSSFVLNGRVAVDQYFENYGTNVSVNLGSAAQTRLDERTTLSGGANVSSSRTTALDIFRIAAVGVPVDAGQILPDVLVPDITTLGTGARTTQLSGYGGIEHVISPIASVGARLNAQYADAAGIGGSDYFQVGAEGHYNHKLSEKTSLVGSLEVTRVRYSGRTRGVTNIISPMLGVQHSLNENTSVNARIGADFTTRPGTAVHVEPSADLSLCHTGRGSALCVSASRSAGATADQGVSTFSSLGISYSLSPSVKDRLTFGASYGRSHSISQAAPLADLSTEVFGGSAEYSRQFDSKTSGFVQASASRYKSFADSDYRTSYQVGLGVKRHFGDVR